MKGKKDSGVVTQVMDMLEMMEIAMQMSGLSRLPEDSMVHVAGDSERPLVAINVGVGEILLARELGCDGVIAHHPLGISHLNFHSVISRHSEFLSHVGASDFEQQVRLLAEKSMLSAHTSIYSQVVESALHLRMPLMNIHLPLDEVGRKIIQEKIDESGPRVADVIKSLSTLKEFTLSKVNPIVVLGDHDAKRGKTFLAMAAGTNGGYEIAKKYFQAGIDTLVYMHIDFEELKKIREDKSLNGKNLLLLGHEPGDSVGINAYLDEIERHGIKPVTIGILR